MTAYIIGGSPRCGKSTLYKLLRPRIKGDSFAYDSLKYMAKEWLPPQVSDLMNAWPVKQYASDTALSHHDLWLRDRLTIASIIWEGVMGYLLERDHEQEDVLTEGIYFPRDVAKLRDLGIDHKAVFLVDETPWHAERAIAIARSEVTVSNNWQQGWSDEEIRQWADLNQLRSREIRRQAQKYGYPVYDVGKVGFAEATRLGANDLGHGF